MSRDKRLLYAVHTRLMISLFEKLNKNDHNCRYYSYLRESNKKHRNRIQRGLFRLLLFQSVGETVISLVVATVTKFSSPIFS